MAKYLSIAGARRLINKAKENFVSATEPVQAAFSTNSGYSDTAGSANKANQATNDAAGNPIHSTYLTIKDADNTYLTKTGNAASATNALTSANCTGNSENSTRLATPRKINVSDATELNVGTAASFDGTSDINIKLPPTIKATLDGNSSSATRATSDSNGNVIINHYAPSYNPVFTGKPQAPTADNGTDNNQLATTAFVQAAIKTLIGTAPETLNTIYELAEAINHDKNFANSIFDALANKQDLNSALNSISNLVTSADKMIYTNSPNSYVTTDLTPFMRTLLDDPDSVTALQTLNALGKFDTAVSATKLETSREISISDGTNSGASTNFDGSSSITLKLPAVIKASLIGNADSATTADFATKAQQDSDGNIISKIYAPLLNPTFKGIPQAPTASSDISDDQIATTKFVANAIENLKSNNPALNSISNLETKADTMIFSTAPNVYDVTTLTPFMRTLLDDSDSATALQTLNALGKNDTAVSALSADFSTKAKCDANGDIISDKYMPKITSTKFNISVDGWIEDSDSDATFNFVYHFSVKGLTANDVVNINIAPDSLGICVNCGLCPTCEISDDIITLRSKSIPTDTISAEFYLLKGLANGKSKSFGCVNCPTSQRVVIYKVPEQVGILTFNNNIQIPAWDDFDPTKILMTGEVSGINADTYNVQFIPIGNCTWADDTRTPKPQTWKINRAVIYKIPSQSGSLTFNGNPQSPILNNFNPEQLTLSGIFENQINAGTYIAYATPTSNFIFSDGSTDSKFFVWSINKAPQNISIDKNSLTLENCCMSDTVIVNRLGDGNISVTSSDENIVTVSNIDNKINVQAVATGNASITIDVAEGTNYFASSVTIPVDCFVIKPLDECTPTEILDAVKSGKAINAWDVGDLTAPLTLNGKIGDALSLENLQIRAMLIGFNHNSELESSGKYSAHFILGTTIDGKNITFIDSIYDRASANGVKYLQHNTTTATNSGGWANSNLRLNICSNIFDALPAEWKNIISPCTKFTDNTGGGVDDSTFVTSTVDKIFLLSEFEIFGKRSYSNLAEPNYQVQYDYFKNGNSKIRYSSVNNDLPCNWWLRTPQFSNDTSFCRVSPSGEVNTYNARYSQGLTPAFIIS